MKKSILVFLVVIHAISLSATSKSYQYKTHHSHTFKLFGDDLLNIKIPNGTIEIIQTNDTSLKIEAEAMCKNKPDCTKLPLSYGDKVKNKINIMKFNVLDADEKQFFEGDRIINLKVYTPFNVRINAETKSGKVIIKSLSKIDSLTIDENFTNSFNHVANKKNNILTLTKKTDSKDNKLSITLNNENIDIK
jgi:hypothetical protein